MQKQVKEKRSEAKRKQTDPLADETISKIMEADATIAVNHFFRLLVENSELPLAEMPKQIKDYFAENSSFPDYTDWDLIKKGELFFATYGPEISMMLLAKSLPASYACRKGAEVLYRTGRLDENRDGGLNRFTRRLVETSQFVIDVMQSDGLGADGRGLRSVQKVRLMHASIRYFLRRKGWDVSEYDEPINQEDMAGTLMDFAVYPIEGLQEIGIDISTEEKEAYFHVWRVVGHFMGVDADLIPTNYADGYRLGHMILNHQKAPSEAGVELAEACIQFMEHITPGTMFDFYPSVLVRYLVGDEVADVLQIKKYKGDEGRLLNRIAFAVFDKWDDLKDNHEIVRRLARKFNNKLLEGMLNYLNNDKQVQFYIPPSLRQNWTQTPVPEVWENTLKTPALAGYRLAIQKHKN